MPMATDFENTVRAHLGNMIGNHLVTDRLVERVMADIRAEAPEAVIGKTQALSSVPLLYSIEDRQRIAAGSRRSLAEVDRLLAEDLTREQAESQAGAPPLDDLERLARCRGQSRRELREHLSRHGTGPEAA